MPEDNFGTCDERLAKPIVQLLTRATCRVLVTFVNLSVHPGSANAQEKSHVIIVADPRTTEQAKVRAISTDWNDGIPAYIQLSQDMTKKLYDAWSMEMSYDKAGRPLHSGRIPLSERLSSFDALCEFLRTRDDPVVPAAKIEYRDSGVRMERRMMR
jgi:hypothetical protein